MLDIPGHTWTDLDWGAFAGCETSWSGCGEARVLDQRALIALLAPVTVALALTLLAALFVTAARMLVAEVGMSSLMTMR